MCLVAVMVSFCLRNRWFRLVAVMEGLHWGCELEEAENVPRPAPCAVALVLM